ncbi:MAG TPA: hypothetical protein V6C86_21090 [Oculatellaceae cyanobacterium]
MLNSNAKADLWDLRQGLRKLYDQADDMYKHYANTPIDADSACRALFEDIEAFANSFSYLRDAA